MQLAKGKENEVTMLLDIFIGGCDQACCEAANKMQQLLVTVGSVSNVPTQTTTQHCGHRPYQ